MGLSRRNLTLHGSNLIFAAVSAALFLKPGWEPALFPGYALILLWNDYRQEEETHVIFLFLATVSAFLAATRAPEAAARAGIGIETVALWLLSSGLGMHRGRLASETYRSLGLIADLDGRIRDSEREFKFYQAYENSAVAQVRLRRDLTLAAKSLGNTMDAQEVKLRLTGILEGRFPGSKVSILPGEPDDPMAQWAISTRTPVVVKDMHIETRFGPRSNRHAFRSALVVPLTVRKRPYGFVRLESPKREAFLHDDLRTVDLYATLASLTLENIQLFGEVHAQALTDSLTQLYTQRAFLQRLQDEILRAGRSQTPMSLIMADIDYFKRYNDTYGHPAGDELLRTVSRLLAAHTRPVDCVARYGGEEFAIVLPAVVHSQAVELAERIRAAVAAEPFLFQGRRTTVTMSFGVSSFPQDATSQSQLIRAADERLYRSKNAGRNQVSG